MNIGLLPARNARYRPNHLAVVFKDQRLTFLDFNKRVNRWANALVKMGVKKGDKVATILPNCLELLETYWAVAKVGAVVVPLSNLLRGKGLTTLINDSDTELILTNKTFVEHLDPLRPDLPKMKADRYVLMDDPNMNGYQYYHSLVSYASEDEPPFVQINDDDPYNIIYSSGTTGLPKGIVHTHYVRANYCMLFSASYRIIPESIIMHAGSLVFNGAFLTLMPAMFLGATYILMDHFDAELTIETIKKEKVTHIKMVPSQIVAMLNSPNFNFENLKSLEMLGTVGAPFHKEHREKLTSIIPNVFYELYGLTEGFIVVLDRTHYATKPMSVGVPLPFYEMRIVDENGKDLPPNEVGEIVGRGPLMMPHYYKRPDVTAQAIKDGWLYSGDMGYVDDDGFLFLVDRKKDMIISGGVNVYPRDIEEVIVQHPSVREVAVFGVPDDKWGETPLAAVILREKGSISPSELKKWINEHVEARYQQVGDVAIMDDFPRSTAGKTLKRVMRDEYWKNKQEKI